MKKIWYFIFTLIVIAILAALFDQKIISVASLNNLQRKVTSPMRDKIQNGSLIFASAGKNFQILELKPDDSKKILFTDIDEKFKITDLANTAVNGKIAAFTNENKLITINFSDLGRVSNISDTIQKNKEFSLSPDDQEYAFVTFSNAERDFGYSLNLINIKTSIAKEIVRYDQSIEDLAWIDQKTIMFIKDNNDIVSYNTISNEEKIIFTANEKDVIFDFSVNGDMILLSQGTISETGCSVYTADLKGDNVKKIYTEKSGTIYDPIFSPDGKNIAYILSPTVSKNYKGYVFNIDISGKNKQKLVQANKLISWIP